MKAGRFPFVETVRNVNALLLLLTLCGIILYFGFQFVVAILATFHQDGITVLPAEPRTTPAESSPPQIELVPRLVGGNYYFEVRTDALREESSTGFKERALAAYPRTDRVVNFIVLKPGRGPGRALLPTNGLVIEWHFVGDEIGEGRTLVKNLFLVVEKDTNGNGLLDRDDEAALVICNAEGEQFWTPITGNLRLTVLAPERAVVKKTTGTVSEFLEVDLASERISSLVRSQDWEIDQGKAVQP